MFRFATALLISLTAFSLYAGHTQVIPLGSVSAAGTTSSYDALSTGNVMPHKHSLQLVITGSPASCTVELDGTLDNPAGAPNWSNLSGSQTCTSLSLLFFSVVDRPVRAVRANITALSAGATVTASYVGVE